MKIKEKQLAKILKNHALWLQTLCKKGKRADLHGVDLSGAYLNEANLMMADLSGANLCGAYLSNANLRGADLRYANFYKACLVDADLRDIKTFRTDFEEACLIDANLSGADIIFTNLRGAKLHGANLTKTRIDCPIACPEKGSFIGYKKVFGEYIVELLIPEDALRCSATSRKCRCSKALVKSITTLNGESDGTTSICSNNDHNFIYTIGETVEVLNFDTDRWRECAPGIHFFITRQEAVDYRY